MIPGAVCSVSDDDVVIFWCPGCETYHGVWTEKANELTGARWTWNGSRDKPTFTPSILVRSGHYVDGKHPCWCDYNAEHSSDARFNCSVCHSFVTDGKIQFLSDCTHKLAGHTVELQPE